MLLLGGGGVLKKKKTLALLLTFTLALGLFDHRCLALECYTRRGIEGALENVTCEAGQRCGVQTQTKNGAISSKDTRCFQDQSKETCTRGIVGDPNCFKATGKLYVELMTKCSNGPDKPTEDQGMEVCTCTTDFCNDNCKCGTGGGGGGGSGSSTAFGTITMVITGLAIILLTGASRWV